MESSFRREDVLSEYITQRSLENSPSDMDMDMDFNDVFGGPPRRFSVQETRVRYSFGESLESEEDSADLTRSSLSGLNEKPVFGEENGNRRRRQGNDFYNDIFKAKGDESYSSPRRTDRDPFGSNPGSRVLSPARPLPPIVEPFDTSFPAQFSLPAKLTKATDLPVFASGVHSPHKSKDVTANATSTSLFRLSGHAVQREKEMKNDIPTSYQQSPLSREVSVSSDELRFMAESDEKGIGGNMKKSPESTEASSNAQQFHFSIYKWAGKGVPLLMPLRGLRGGKHFKAKENITIERCSSSNGRMDINNNMDISLSAGENLNIFKDANSDSSRTTSKKEVSGDRNNKEPYGIAGETLDNPKSNSLQSVPYTIVVDGPMLSTEIEGEEPQSRQRTGLFVGVDKQVPRNSDGTSKTELKPFSAFLTNEAKEQDNRKMAQETEGKSSMAKTTQATESDVKVNNNMKKTDVVADKKLKKGDAEVTNNTRKSDSGANRNGKRGVGNKVTSDKGGINSDSISGSTLRSSEKSTKAGIKGKVQDFVKKFNQEVNSTPKEVESRSQSFRRKASSNNDLDSEKSFRTHQEEKVQLPTMNKMQDPTDNEGQNLNNQENMTKYSQTKTSTPHTKKISDQKAAPPITESIQDDPRVSAGSMDDIFHGNYVVEEIFEDHDKTSHANGKSEDIQASDAKVHQWLQGRKGNIRSLLSTLQNVLWAESGWKPVPLVDLIEGKSVKRSYQRALLYLHPDKLQQKGAAAHQKYIAEKVFENLQEAWDHFNSVGAI